MPMYFTLNIQTQQTLFERVAKRSHYTAGLEYLLMYYFMKKNVNKRKVKVHPCTDTEALYRPYGP